MFICYLGIGSNLGSRRKNIQEAIKRINALKNTKVIKVSKIIETQALGGPPQGKFLNAAIKVQTSFNPPAFLKQLKRIEKDLGRHKTVRFGPRTIDLDILLYGNKIINRKELKVPHPRMFEREFVMEPLCQII
jgi:2-amino-4-hydroxy-6-hydroxymethyldihydropteridine diphosphokinase